MEFPTHDRTPYRRGAMKKYRVSVCKGPDCKMGGSDHVFTALKARVQEKGLAARCELFRGGCYGVCHLGPTLVIREHNGKPRDPLSRDDFQLIQRDGEVHYDSMTPEKMIQIVDEHLEKDHPVESLRSTGEERKP
ncbi:MAG: (2Fe-2S) ferredoxin domain-containing protein [Myxococcaceae bacterium]